MPSPHPRPGPSPTGVRSGVAPARRVAAVVLTVAGLPLGTLVLSGAGADLALGSVLLLYLLAVVVSAAVGGLGPGLLAAGLSFALANWFFTPPVRTLTIGGRDDLVELLVFAGAAVVVSAVVELAARDRAGHQRQLAEQTARTRELAAEDRVRTALLAAVGHDFRTPLASTKAAVSSLRTPGVGWTAESRAELLATIEESTDRLAHLVTNVLDMSRLRADAVTVRAEPVALDEVVSRALLTEHRPTVRVEVADDLPLVLADAGLLERVVENLVQNALRFSPPGTPVVLSATADDDRVVLHVVDHGPGVPPDRRAAMFTPFDRLGDHGPGSGVGLGLAIARGFTDAMGGSLTPSTTPGGGLTMDVALPRAAS